MRDLEYMAIEVEVRNMKENQQRNAKPKRK